VVRVGNPVENPVPNAAVEVAFPLPVPVVLELGSAVLVPMEIGLVVPRVGPVVEVIVTGFYMLGKRRRKGKEEVPLEFKQISQFQLIMYSALK
jgi:hypothetical protein